MDIQAIAISRSAGALWIRLGAVLDATVAHKPHEVVERIVSMPAGFLVEVRDTVTSAARFYEVPGYFVTRIELLTEPRSGKERLN